MPPVHPGEVLREDYLKAIGMSAHALAQALRIPSTRLYEILAGRRSITPETALRLARHLGTSAEVWLGLQADYDLEIARAAVGTRVEREVERRRTAP
ncbi:MAG: HigA family addiction module antitoxin [Candidatus Binatus sp.]